MNAVMVQSITGTMAMTTSKIAIRRNSGA